MEKYQESEQALKIIIETAKEAGFDIRAEHTGTYDPTDVESIEDIDITMFETLHIYA